MIKTEDFANEHVPAEYRSLLYVARHYDESFNPGSLRSLSDNVCSGSVSLSDLERIAKNLGFMTQSQRITFRQLIDHIPLPCITTIDKNHVVIIKRPLQGRLRKRVHFFHPCSGQTSCSEDEFAAMWGRHGNHSHQFQGLVLMLEPQVKKRTMTPQTKIDWHWLIRQFLSSKWEATQVFLTIFVSCVLQLAFPFLMQNIVDRGISSGDMHFIGIVLIAQLVLMVCRAFTDSIRQYILLYVSSLINFSVLSDFWSKLLRLPLSTFENYSTGDIWQRMNDNTYVQRFLTGSAIQTILVLINTVIFSVVLLYYQATLFLIFCLSMVLYFLWVTLFLTIRKKLNEQIFEHSSNENNAILHLVQGIADIKLQNIEKSKQWEWQSTQATSFRLNFKRLTYDNIQYSGIMLLRYGTDLVLLFVAANLVIQGNLTLGAMLAIQFIIASLTGGIDHITTFPQAAQEATLSLKRLNEIHSIPDEEHEEKTYLKEMPSSRDIVFKHVTFRYPGNDTNDVLTDIELHIPQGKTTAIVGVSGSGKTTLLKLLLRYYKNYSGSITIGGVPLSKFSPSFWRKNCGAVMLDGYIFNTTIERNIAVDNEEIDHDKLIHACITANILAFIESLPNGFSTKLGNKGMSLSSGQKQRILIARIIYKNPEYIFFDEATNALDAENEATILENMRAFSKGKTVIVVAHRFSTVKNADKIVVINKGKIIEQGSHSELAELRGKYFELVKNQIELN